MVQREYSYSIYKILLEAVDAALMTGVIAILFTVLKPADKKSQGLIEERKETKNEALQRLYRY